MLENQPHGLEVFIVSGVRVPGLGNGLHELQCGVVVYIGDKLHLGIGAVKPSEKCFKSAFVLVQGRFATVRTVRLFEIHFPRIRQDQAGLPLEILCGLHVESGFLQSGSLKNPFLVPRGFLRVLSGRARRPIGIEQREIALQTVLLDTEVISFASGGLDDLPCSPCAAGIAFLVRCHVAGPFGACRSHAFFATISGKMLEKPLNDAIVLHHRAFCVHSGVLKLFRDAQAAFASSTTNR